MAEDQPIYDITVEIDPPYVAEVDSAALEQIASAVLLREGIDGSAELGIWITNEDEIHKLNRNYRGVDASTDVLSFGNQDADEAGFVHVPDEPRHLGDIAISYPHVVRQAEEYGHSRRRELAYLLVHGVLHVLGHDHEEPAGAATMREHEEAALNALGIPRHDDAATAGIA